MLATMTMATAVIATPTNEEILEIIEALAGLEELARRLAVAKGHRRRRGDAHRADRPAPRQGNQQSGGREAAQAISQDPAGRLFWVPEPTAVLAPEAYPEHTVAS
jgi:hypothetical protein